MLSRTRGINTLHAASNLQKGVHGKLYIRSRVSHANTVGTDLKGMAEGGRAYHTDVWGMAVYLYLLNMLQSLPNMVLPLLLKRERRIVFPPSGLVHISFTFPFFISFFYLASFLIFFLLSFRFLHPLAFCYFFFSLSSSFHVSFKFSHSYFFLYSFLLFPSVWLPVCLAFFV